MDRDTFLMKLRQALAGLLLAEEVEQHVEYYRNYINMQMRMGQTEAEVLGALGDPRLIAKSILSVSDSVAEEKTYEEEAYERPSHGKKIVINGTKMPAWLVLLIVGIIVVMVLLLVVRIVASLAWIIVPVIVVCLIVKYFRDWMR